MDSPRVFSSYVSVYYSIEPTRSKWHQGRLQGRFFLGVSEIDSQTLSVTNSFDASSNRRRKISRSSSQRAESESKAIDTIYHESTHAFIDLMSEAAVIRSGEPSSRMEKHITQRAPRERRGSMEGQICRAFVPRSRQHVCPAGGRAIGGKGTRC